MRYTCGSAGTAHDIIHGYMGKRYQQHLVEKGVTGKERQSTRRIYDSLDRGWVVNIDCIVFFICCHRRARLLGNLGIKSCDHCLCMVRVV